MLKKLARGMLRIAGWETVGEAPAVDKAVLILAPHTSNWDGLWVLAYKVAMGIDARFFGKHTLFWWPLGNILRHMGAIPVNRNEKNCSSPSSSASDTEGEPAVLSLELRKQLYDHYMTEAVRWVGRLKEEPSEALESLADELGELQFFSLPSNATSRHKH